MIQLVLQGLLVVAASTGTLVLVGLAIYVGLVVLVFLVTLGLIYTRHGVIENDEHAPTLAWLSITALIAGVFGVFWPMLPLAFAWRDVFSGARKRADAAQGADGKRDA